MKNAEAKNQTNGDGTEAHLDEVIGDIQGIMQQHDINQAQVAREAGISATTLSQLLSGSYPANPKKTHEKLVRWVSSKRAKAVSHHALPTAKPWTSTPTSERIMAALGYAQMAGDISVVYGAAGLGKTATAREYASRMPNVWVVTATAATTCSVSMCLETVLIALGVRELPQGAARMEREAVKRMNNSGGLLIVDEAQNLCLQALEEIRSLHDATGIGVALLGNEVIYARMTGGTRAAYLDRLFSRIGKRVKLQHAVKDDIIAVAATYGVHGDECLRVLADIGGRAGGLRSVVKTIRIALMMCGGDQLDARHLRAAFKDLEG